MTRPTGRVSGLWWLSPTGAVALIVPVTLFLAWWFDDRTYRIAWRTAKSLQDGTVALLFAGAMVFMTAALLPLFGPRRAAAQPWPDIPDPVHRRLLTASNWLFWITVLGYAVLGFQGFRNGVGPRELVEAFLSRNVDDGRIKAAFVTLPGVSTLTQVGIAFAVIATLVLFRRWSGRVAWQLGVLLVLTLGRSYLLTERLALLEVVIPMLAVAAMVWHGSRRPWVRRVVVGAPAIFLPLVLALFGLFEYTRSWNWYSAKGGNFADFVLQRIAGYYVTAYNNGQLALTYEKVDGSLPYRTLEAFWTAPGIKQLDLYGHLSGVTNNDFTQILNLHGSPEFNSPCGLCDPFVDWGPVGGFVVLAALGLILGVAYRGFADARLFWVVLYPALVPGLFELPRYLSWTKGRLVPALLALAFVAWWTGRARREAPPPEEPAGEAVGVGVGVPAGESGGPR